MVIVQSERREWIEPSGAGPFNESGYVFRMGEKVEVCTGSIRFAGVIAGPASPDTSDDGRHAMYAVDGLGTDQKFMVNEMCLWPVADS